MIAQNNIFNIRVGSSWLGSSGSYKGFVCFRSVDFGIRAWLILMRTYRHKYMITTIQGIVSRFAPSSENDTARYIAFVARCSVLPADAFLSSDDQYYEIAIWMARMESGYSLKVSDVRRVARLYNIQIVPVNEVRGY